MAVSVKFGSARIDERGKTTGGAAGDQTGNEVSVQNWYLHSKGWRVFRAVSAAAAEAIAVCMEAACANNNIGYDQNQRNTLYNAVKSLGFDVRKLTTKVETDCSALIRVCLAFAGIMVSDFNTATEAGVLLASGAFVELTDSKYTKQSAYLRRGDILVTRTKGHTGAILSNGSEAESTPAVKVYKLGDRILKNGMDGADVKELQTMLIQLGYSCGSWGADGEFGDATELAVRKFQRDHGCQADGEVGPETLGALKEALGGGDGMAGDTVRFVGGQCYVRATPDKISGKVLGVAAEGSTFTYGGEQSGDGWLRIVYNDGGGWVSGLYGKLVA